MMKLSLLLFTVISLSAKAELSNSILNPTSINSKYVVDLSSPLFCTDLHKIACENLETPLLGPTGKTQHVPIKSRTSPQAMKQGLLLSKPHLDVTESMLRAFQKGHLNTLYEQFKDDPQIQNVCSNSSDLACSGTNCFNANACARAYLSKKTSKLKNSCSCHLSQLALETYYGFILDGIEVHTTEPDRALFPKGKNTLKKASSTEKKLAKPVGALSRILKKPVKTGNNPLSNTIENELSRALAIFDKDTFGPRLRRIALESIRLDVGEGLEKRREKVKELFPKLVTTLQERLRKDLKCQGNVNCQSQLDFAVEKIGRLSWGGSSDCTVQSKNSDISLEAKLEPYELYVTVCDKVLAEMGSDSNMIFILAHEMCHAIDPCHIQKDFIDMPASPKQLLSSKEYIYPELIDCLRSSQSVKSAKPTTTNKSPKFCNQGFDVDQMKECSSDWCAQKVWLDFLQSDPRFSKLENKKQSLSARQKGYRAAAVNAVRPFCDNGTGVATHPNSKDRINHLFLMNPELRKRMGCEGVPSPRGKIYCEGIAK